MGKKAALITAAAASAVILGGTTVAAVASSQQARDAQRWGSIPVLSPLSSVGLDDDNDYEGPPLAAADWDKAASAALAQVGQGRVSEVERENEAGSAYEVEVRLDNGTQVEVLLGTNFEVLRQGAPEYDDD